ncbi:TPM domain-containing protein [Microbacterium awajiense]|uniref:TPM domain-containing protein n=1 Tax=Microbacterium awajiense TaxID=415214 RepID=A0ABP7AFD5_9MICO
MRARWALSLTAALALMFAATTSASATDPVALGSQYVLDDAGALSDSERTAAEERLERLSSETDVDLWVVYVDEFTNPSDAESWADQTAIDNGLGPNQYLLAVAVDARQYYLSGDSAGPVSFDQLGQIEQQLIQPELSAEDWSGAAIAAADGLQDAAGGGTGGFPMWIIVVLVVAAIGVVAWVIIRRRRRGVGGSAGGADAVTTAELARRAASALVATDDALKTSEQELGFAKAQFGEAATAPFQQALAAARGALDEAFTLQQQLDDSEPDTEQQVREWNTRILELCENANRELDEKAADFDELRRLEQNAPAALERIRTESRTAAGALDAASATLATLTGRYAPEALATIADNPEQARDRLAFAEEQLAAAQTAIEGGDGGEAAISLRAAEEAVGQAELLEQAIDKLAADLAEAEKTAATLIADIEGDIAAAGSLPDPDGHVAGAIAAARTQLDGARTDLAGPDTRPLAALERLEGANRQIDTVIQQVRDAAAQAERARQMLGQTIMKAQAQVSAAEDYITARRGAVGAEARTRLAQAGASLVQAQQLQAGDPQTALQHAQRADQLAGEAIRSAQSDVGSFAGGGGLLPTGRSSGGGGGDLMGAVLGGILINSAVGGGRSSSSRRTTSRPSMRTSGGLSSSSFGGGGTRRRRGGGRF